MLRGPVQSPGTDRVRRTPWPARSSRRTRVRSLGSVIPAAVIVVISCIVGPLHTPLDSAHSNAPTRMSMRVASSIQSGLGAPLTLLEPDSIGLGVSGPYGPAYDPQNGFVYVTDIASNNVTVINGSTVQGVIAVPYAASNAVFDSSDGFVYVTDSGATAFVLDGLSVVATISIGDGPHSTTFDGEDDDVYISNSMSDNVSVISGTSLVATIGDLTAPHGLAYDSASGEVYAVGGFVGGDPYESGTVTILNGTTVVASVDDAGYWPWADTYDPSNGYVYVTNRDSGNVTVLDGSSIVGWITTGLDPNDPFFDSANGFVYVPNQESANVTVINGTRGVAYLTPGPGPSSGVFDSGNGQVYVTGAEVGYESSYVAVLNGTILYPYVADFESSPSSVEVGSLTNATATLAVTLGRGLPSPSYSYVGLPSDCTSSNVSALSCTPDAGGQYAVKVYVNFTGGFGTSSALELDVAPSLAVSPISTLDPTDAGYARPFEVFVSGGTAPYSWNWDFGDGSDSSGVVPVHSYALPGNYTAEVWINDSAGSSAVRDLQVSVDPALRVVASYSSVNPPLGSSFAIHEEVSGGRAPYAYSYLGLPPGCVSENSSELACVPSEVGTYNVTISVVDQNEVTINSTQQVHVVAANPASGPLRLGELGLAAILGAGAAAVVAGVLWMRRRRKGRSSEPTRDR